MADSIDWTNDQSHILINPRMPVDQKKQAKNIFQKYKELKAHVWVSSSGSSALKWIALSKEAILCSADAVNKHLEVSSKDIWLNPLPDFHVGGMGINARGYLSNSSVQKYTSEKWQVNHFYEALCAHKVTLTALVPTQVYDLVQANLRAPSHLRGVIVGGGRLSDHLFHGARELGWPVLPSYGLTECASQVATAELDGNSQLGIVLSHCEIKIDDDGFIALKSPSLLTGYVLEGDKNCEFMDPKTDEWFHTEDKGILHGKFLECLGRANNFIKIGGESVDLARLEGILDRIKLQSITEEDLALVAMPDARLGHVVHLAYTGVNPQNIVESYNNLVMPFERIRHSHAVASIPRTALNKLRRNDLLVYLRTKDNKDAKDLKDTK